MKDVNRHALIMTPLPSFFAMLSRISGEKFEAPVATENDTSRVYLTPGDFLYQEEALEWLEENRQIFFEEEIYGWFTEEDKYPQDITWEEFQDYFTFSFQSMVTDTAPEDAVYQSEEEEPAS